MDEFLLEPSKIVFSNFEPLKEIKKKFRFKNKSKKSTRVKFVLQNSEYFKLIGPTVSGKKTSLLSPGLEAVCTILFLPVEKVDYSAELVVHTTEKKYTVPLIACVGQADVRFPSVINFNDCAVKHNTEKVIYIQNQGQKSTRIILNLPEPFSVEPTEIFLNKEEGKQITFSFHPKSIGSFHKTLRIEYEEDDLIDQVKMTGVSKNVRCLLSVKNVKFPPTFIVTKSVKEVYLYNKSNIKLNYKFTRFEKEEEEENFVRMKELQHEITDSSDLLFKDDVFGLYPLKGEIWPNSKAFVNVVFIPNNEDSFKKVAYCEITGKDTRLSLNLLGEGKGPEIVFSYSKLDVGNVYIHNTHNYEIFLENRGEIDANFELKPSKSLFGSKFQFEPSKGNLEGGGLQEIKVTFAPNVIGSFFEAFNWKISGRAKPITNVFSGKVIGPTAQFNKEVINFGRVSYGFLNTEDVVLKNTSEIPMNFRLRVPKDGTLLNKEFDIIPKGGTILPHAHKTIRIEFLSHHEKDYDCELVLDVDDLGEDTQQIPILASCVVPRIDVSSKRINFGYCFVGYQYTRAIELVNNSGNEKAKYEVILPNDIEEIKIVSETPKGVINSRDTTQVRFTLVVKKITEIEFPIFIRIIGSIENPFEVTVVCKSIGPIVESSSKSLDFGRVDVLVDYEKSIRLYNKSPIIAHFSTNQKNRAFQCLNPTGVISPNNYLDLRVKANLDESQIFKDSLKVSIRGEAEKENQLLSIGLLAKGKGCSLTSNIDMTKIDFSNIFTKKKEVVNFQITNHGKQPRQLLWKSTRKKQKPGSDIKPPPVVFKILPDRSVINPKSSLCFQCVALSKAPGEFTEGFIATIPSKRKDIFKVQVMGKFSVPLISFPQQKPMRFNYIHTTEKPPIVQTKKLVIKNTTILDLSVTLKTSGPFKVDNTNHVIKSQENILVEVIFDPDFKKDKLSQTVKSKILICYKDHPQVDSFDLIGSISFPNLKFSQKEVDFGVIQVGEEVTKQIEVKSTSKSNVNFSWIFEVTNEDEERHFSSFDILPINGVIKSGDSCTMDFLYLGKTIQPKKVKAICVVEGGPKYSFMLKGDCGKVKYKIDIKKLEYGIINFNQIEMREIILQNTGRVNFVFSFDTSLFFHPDIITFQPKEGKVKAGRKVKINVRFCPSVPGIFDNFVKLHINNFEPDMIKVTGVSICPSLHLNLSRKKDMEEVEALMNIEKGKNMDKKLMTFFKKESKEFKTTQSSTDMAEYNIIREVEMIKLRKFLSKKTLQFPPKLKKLVKLGSKRRMSKKESKSTLLFSQMQYSLSTYVLDFGYVVKGLTRKKKFVVTNIGYSPITINVSKKVYSKHGIVLEPSCVSNLPRYEKQEFELVLQTKKIPSDGKFCFEAPLSIVNGPTINVKVDAVIVVPKISVDRKSLDFGTLYVGKCKVITIQFQNDEEIKCDWFVDPKYLRKENNFVCMEKKGTVLPKEQKNFEIWFYPTSRKKFQQTINIKCKYGQKPIQIECRGVGEEVDLELSDTKFFFGPTLPHTKVEKELTITNKSDTDVEIYAVNFDKKFLEDIEILKENKDKFSEDLCLMIDPQKPGTGLPDFLNKAVDKKSLDDENPLPQKQIVKEDDKKKKRRFTQSRVKKREKQEDVGMGKIENVVEQPKKKVFLFFGPNGSRKSSVASSLSQSLKLPVISIGELLKDIEIKEEGEIEKKVLRAVTPKKSSRSSRKGGKEKTKEEIIIVDPQFEQLQQIIKEMLTKEIFKNGVILEDIITEKFEKLEKIIKILMLEDTVSFYTYVFSPKEKFLLLERLNQMKNHFEKKVEENKVPNILEEEFEGMSEVEQELYRTLVGKRRQFVRKLNGVKKEIKELESRILPEDEDIVANIKKLEKQEIELKKHSEQKKRKKRKQKKKETETVVADFRNNFILCEKDNPLERNIKIFQRNFNDIDTLVSNENEKEEKIFFRVIRTSEKNDYEIFTELWEQFPEKESFKKFSGDKLNSLKISPTPRTLKPVLEIPGEYVKQIIKYPDSSSYFASYVFSDSNNLFDITKDGNRSTRWIIEKKSSITLKVTFFSEHPFKNLIKNKIKFCCNDSSKEYILNCTSKCVYPEINPKKIFRNVVKSINTKRFAVKKYVTSEEYFGFGALLILPDYSKRHEEKSSFKKYYENFTFVNEGELDCKIDFCLENEIDEEGKGFEIEPKSITVTPKSKKKMTVFCLPKNVGTFKNKVVCCIENNPIPYSFNVRYNGATPDLEISSRNVDFGKLLLGDEEKRKTIKIRNISIIPVEWKIEYKNEKPPELKIFPSSDTLKPNETTEIFFELDCNKACEIRTKILFEISDRMGIVKNKSKDVLVTAETYNLKISLERKINFGVIKVSESTERRFKIKNEGKYPILYKFGIPNRFKKFFTITPMEGTLMGSIMVAEHSSSRSSRKKKRKKKVTEVDEEKTRKEIIIRFKSTKEINIKRNSEIICEFFDPEKPSSIVNVTPRDKFEKLGESSLSISLKAKYNEYEILPVKGINFGPLFSGKSITKNLTIFNRGSFPFNFELFDFKNPRSKLPHVASVKEKSVSQKSDKLSKRKGKQQKKKRGKEKEVKEDLLQIGNFTITPNKGTLPSKSSVEITVQFSAEGSGTFHRVLGIDVTDRNPTNFPNGFSFDLQGVSCISGIETSDFNSIFEEQHIVEKMSDLKRNQSGFCTSEKIFSFGVVTTKKKVTEKFKISNIMKVPCDVEFAITTNEPKKKKKDVEDIFDISPKKFHLQSHEHQYVAVTFSPTELKNYFGVFTASVVGGEKKSKHTNLTVKIRGSGSLPQVDVVSPISTNKDENNNYLVNFKRTLLGRIDRKIIKIRNKGVLDATVRFSMRHYESILFADIENEIHLAGGENRDFEIKFCPNEIEKIDTILSMSVLENSLENKKFRIIAIGYEEDVTFKNVPKDLDYLSLENCGVGKNEEIPFQIESNCKYPVKFEWIDSIDSVTISPKVGHLHPGKSKDVFVKFFTSKPIHKSERLKKLQLKFEKIQFNQNLEEVTDWDDRHTFVKWVKEEIKPVVVDEVERPISKKNKRGTKKSGRSKKKQSKRDVPVVEIKVEEKPAEPPKIVIKKVNQVYPEPLNKSISKEKVIDLPIKICADYAKYELSVDPKEKIKFASTNIFSTRKYALFLKNTGNVSLKYRFDFRDDLGAFFIENGMGSLKLGEEKEIIIKYCPKFVGKHKTYLNLTIPNQDVSEKEQLTTSFYLTGKSTCPVVHFEVNPSDYLTANRRDPELPGTPPSVDTKVIEMNCCGVKTKSTKRFYVLNPTNTSYEYYWKRVGFKKGKKAKNYFKCKSKKGVIKTGKKTEMVFEFVPDVVATKESLWKFIIPERRLEIPFLLVGHAKEPQLYLSHSHLNFQIVMVGAKRKNEIKLINREDIPFSFQFRSLNKLSNVCDVSPKQGTIGANSVFPIKIKFKPKKEIGYNINLVCKVKKKPQKLVCNIKGEGCFFHKNKTLQRNRDLSFNPLEKGMEEKIQAPVIKD